MSKERKMKAIWHSTASTCSDCVFVTTFRPALNST